MDKKLINRRNFIKSSVAGMAGFICHTAVGKKREENKK